MGELVDLPERSSFIPKPPRLEPNSEAQDAERESLVVECADRMLGMVEVKWDGPWTRAYPADVLQEAKTRAIEKLNGIQQARIQKNEELKKADTEPKVIKKLEEQ